MGTVRTEHNVAVPVAPIERMRHKERRHDAKPLHAIELILAHGLGVDHHRATIGQTMLGRGLLHRIQELIA